MNRLNIVTLGVKDLKKSKQFFGALFGWRPTKKESNDIAFYDMGGWLMALFPRAHLAADIGVEPNGTGFSGVTLAHNVRNKEEVAPLLARATALGAEIVKPAQDVFWGGHSGYFRDPDGHYWEVAWNPFTPTLPDGTLSIQPD
jgi:catechol 2,3-dioxygenase-like lactoylglutathione lyase family enzyme